VKLAVWFPTVPVGVTVRRSGQTKTVQRNPNASWSLLVEGMGTISIANPVLEEIMFRLGELQASAWVDKGAANRLALGFTESSDRISIELRNGEKPTPLVLEFGQPGISPTSLPYALAEADGQTWIFETDPSTLYFDVVRYLFEPLFPPITPKP